MSARTKLSVSLPAHQHPVGTKLKLTVTDYYQAEFTVVESSGRGVVAETPLPMLGLRRALLVAPDGTRMILEAVLPEEKI